MGEDRSDEGRAARRKHAGVALCAAQGGPRRAADACRQTVTGTNRCLAEVVRTSPSRVACTESESPGASAQAAGAEDGEGDDLDRGLAAGGVAPAGRRLPQRDALSPPRRPRPEAGRRATGLSPGPDADLGEGEALASAPAEWVADLVPPHRPGELDDR